MTTMTTGTALVNILNTQRYAVIRHLDEIAGYVYDNYNNIRFQSADDLINTDIDIVVNCVNQCIDNFERRNVDQYLADVKFSALLVNNAINTNNVRVRSEAIKLNEVTNVLSRIAIELDSRVCCDD